MRWFKKDLLRLFSWPALAVMLMLFNGCQTTAPQNLCTVSGPGWKVRQGQALWRPRQGAPDFGGDLILATNTNGDSFIEFDKMPLTLVSAQITPTRWLVRFPQQQSVYSGRTPAPVRVIWFYLPAALAGEPLPKPLHFERKSGGGWQLNNSQTGETLDGFLSP
jgi:hypothetical protein